MEWIDNFDLNFEASVYQRAWVPDGMGGGSYTETLRSTFRCALWQASAREQLFADRVHDKSTHKLACKPDARFEADDIVKVGGVEYKMGRPDDVLGNNEIMVINLELIE